MQTRSLKCILTPKQLEERGASLAEKVHALSALEAKKKNAAADYKGQIEELEDEMAGLAREVSERVLRPDEMQGELKLMRSGAKAEAAE